MGFIKSQFTRLPYPTQPFDGQTLIITGANVGLGLEAARHITRLGAARVILACRSFQKGQEAQKSIEQSTGRLGVCEVWPLDMEDFDSVKEFAERAAKLDRLDVLLANAGIALLGDELSWSKKADMETTVAVNVVGTFLLALLVLPILRKTGQKYGIIPRLTITSSEVHGWAHFKERDEPLIFEALKKNNIPYLKDRYRVSKLLEVFTVRTLAKEMNVGPHSSEKVILNTVNPGFCHSSLARRATGFMLIQATIMKFFLARTTEVGGRTLVASVGAGYESHGQYMADCVVAQPSDFVLSDEGKKTEARVYKELMDILEGIQPGIAKNI